MQPRFMQIFNTYCDNNTIFYLGSLFYLNFDFLVNGIFPHSRLQHRFKNNHVSFQSNCNCDQIAFGIPASSVARNTRQNVFCNASVNADGCLVKSKCHVVGHMQSEVR